MSIPEISLVHSPLARNTPLAHRAIAWMVVGITLGSLGLMASAWCALAQQASDRAAAPVAATQATKPAKGKKVKDVYTGPTTIVVLPATPMLDVEIGRAHV